MTTPTPDQAAERVTAYLDGFAKTTDGRDRIDHLGWEDQPTVVLTVSDLRALLAERQQLTTETGLLGFRVREQADALDRFALAAHQRLLRADRAEAERDQARAQLADATDRAETAEAQLADMHRREEQRIAREFQRLGDRMQLASRRALRIADTAAALAAPVPQDAAESHADDPTHPGAGRETTEAPETASEAQKTHILDAYEIPQTLRDAWAATTKSPAEYAIVDHQYGVRYDWADGGTDDLPFPTRADAEADIAEDPAYRTLIIRTRTRPIPPYGPWLLVAATSTQASEPQKPPQDDRCGHGPDWWATGLGGIAGCMVCGPQPPAEPTPSDQASEETPE